MQHFTIKKLTDGHCPSVFLCCEWRGNEVVLYLKVAKRPLSRAAHRSRGILRLRLRAAQDDVKGNATYQARHCEEPLYGDVAISAPYYLKPFSIRCAEFRAYALTREYSRPAYYGGRNPKRLPQGGGSCRQSRLMRV